jgi:hypothetical protein
MRSALYWQITQCILVCQYILYNFPEERRSQVLLHLASDNHSDDKLLSQFGSDSYSDTKVVYQLESNSHSDSKISQLDSHSHNDSDIL